MQRAAVIGLGTIGGTIARDLVAEDVPLNVYDIRPETETDLVTAGARAATSAADAARDADVVIMAVVDDTQLLDAITGADGVLTAARPGTVIVVHSTVKVDTIEAVATQAAEHDVRVIDAGVSTRGDKGTGKLAVFVGGDDADVEAARPVIERYSHDIEHIGPLGSGMAAKLVRNLLGYACMAAAYETLALAERVGIDLDIFHQVLEDSDPVGQAQLILAEPTTLPVTASEKAAAFAGGLTGSTGRELIATLEGAVSLMSKDIDEIVALAERVGFDLRMTEPARHLLRPMMLLPDDDRSR